MTWDLIFWTQDVDLLPGEVGEDGVNWPFFYKTIYLKIEDVFLHPLNAGRSGIHFTLLGCKLKMMG